MSQSPKTIQKQGKKATFKSKNTPYDKFLMSIESEATKETYGYHLREFLNYAKRHSKIKDYAQLLELSDKERFDLIQQYVMYEKHDKKLSFSTMNSSMSSIRLFYEANGVEISHWKQLSKLKGKKRKVIIDRTYSEEELKRLIEYADIRERVIILTMLSTGMRVGALATLRIGDIQKINLPEEHGGHEIYRFKPYSEDSNENYITFCTPECAKAIDTYLDDRTKAGEKISKESAFITHKIKSPYLDKNNGFLDVRAIQRLLDRERYNANIMEPTAVKDISTIGKQLLRQKENKGKRITQLTRKAVMRTHAFRKYFNTQCIEKNVNHSVKEYLMGHKSGLGLDVHYYRPQDERKLLDEYVKVIDVLTVNDENRLRQKTQELEKKVEDISTLKQQVRELMKEKDKIESEFIDVVQQSYDYETYTKAEFEHLRNEINRLKSGGILKISETKQKKKEPTRKGKLGKWDKKKVERRREKFQGKK